MLLNSEGHLKCIDFGTAKFLDADKRSSELYGNKDKKNETIEVELDPSSVKRKFDHRSTFVGTAQYTLFLIIFKLCMKKDMYHQKCLKKVHVMHQLIYGLLVFYLICYYLISI